MVPENKKETDLLLVGALLLGLVLMMALLGGGSEPRMLDLEPGDPYTEDWAMVAHYDEEALVESAMARILEIEAMARKDGNEVQVVKAVVQWIDHRYQKGGGWQLEAEKMLKEAIGRSKFPMRQVFHSILGQFYGDLRSGGIGYPEGRTEVEGLLDEDMRTWDAKRFEKAANAQWQLSLACPDSLRRVAISYCVPILSGTPSSAYYRPSLLDLLAWRAISYYEKHFADPNQPANAFMLNDTALFAADKVFLKAKFETEDSTSYRLAAVHVLQTLTAAHQWDKDPFARVLVNIDRLKFGAVHGAFDLRDSLYLQALERLWKENLEDPASAFAAAEIAKAHLKPVSDGRDVVEPEYKDGRKKAMAVLQQTLALHDEGGGVRFCEDIRDELLAKRLSFHTEEYPAIGSAFLASLSYLNVPDAWFRIIKIGEKDKEKREQQYESEWLAALIARPSLREWHLSLPGSEDYNLHRLEMTLPALPGGSYLIVGASDPAFKIDSAHVCWAMVDVTDIGHSSLRLPDGRLEHLVMDRVTGQPLADVLVRVYRRYYRKEFRTDSLVFQTNLHTDQNGSLIVPAGMNDSEYLMRFIHGEDSILAKEFGQNWSPPEPETKQRETVFFSDRRIYRPGQTVYFKGIVLEKFAGIPSIVPNYSETVYLRDVNGREAGKLEVRTNEFGSFAGSFVIPKDGMNGEMRIYDKHGAYYFNVEDYKRPQFEVVLDPLKGSFRLGNTVKLHGKAAAFAGSNISGATVNYHVTRDVSFPWCSYWGWRGSFPTRPQAEVKVGSVTTDATGGFEIPFEALPDPTLNSELRPRYGYTVVVDVVDITGETHSATTTVAVGHQAIDLRMALPDQVEKSAFKGLKIEANNLSGVAVRTKGHVVIHRLAAPERVYDHKNWWKPDHFLLSREQFHAVHPNVEYRDESDPEQWQFHATAFEGEFDTRYEDSLWLPSLKYWVQGAYLLEATCRDSFGTEVKYRQVFKVYGKEETRVPLAEQLWLGNLADTYEPGDTAVLDLGTGYDDAWLRYDVHFNGKIEASEWVCISPERIRLRFPVLEKHRGGFYVLLFMVKNGQPVQQNVYVNVPWTNKELDIEFATFRDKLLPGAEEEWTVKIKGPKGEKVAAELLAGMYDQSLDAFGPHRWELPGFPSTYASSMWDHPYSFGILQSLVRPDYWGLRRIAFELPFDALEFGTWAYQSANSPHDRYTLGLPAPAYYNGWGYQRGRGDYSPYAYTWNRYSDYSQNSYVGFRGVMRGGNWRNLNAFYIDQTEVTNAGTYSTLVTNGMNATFATTPDDSRSLNASLANVSIRRNLQETAFFFPQLRTDAEGNVILHFKMPEALTKWKLMTLTHTKSMQSAYKEASLVTQKELMVQPNPPRFFREGDEFEFGAKVSNLSDRDMRGIAKLELRDATTMLPIDAALGNVKPTQQIDLKKGESKAVSWKLKIPAGIQAVTYTVKATDGKFGDAEESSLPVLTNTMLVTEAMPMPLRPKETKTFDFKRLRTLRSPTMRHERFTLEFTSNPAWYAIQALPYMMEYPHECAEQTFSRYYANSIAHHIAASNPRIKAVFDQWKASGGKAFTSKLEQNEELKSILQQETPWVLNAQNESERKRQVGMLFDMARMSEELGRARKKLLEAQAGNGGFSWFPGMKPSRYITQHIVAGFGHLDRLGVKSLREDYEIASMLSRALDFLDRQVSEDYQLLLDTKANLKRNHLTGDIVYYLYGSSFYNGLPGSGVRSEAYRYYFDQALHYWTTFNPYHKGMIALALYRSDHSLTAGKIMRSLKEYSHTDPEMGMYWEPDGDGMYWYQAPIETQALLIEAFDEVAHDTASVEEMKIWLLKQKQTQDWKTTKATAEACYALLLHGTDLLAESGIVGVMVGNEKIEDGLREGLGLLSSKNSSRDFAIASQLGEGVGASGQGPEAGTGYFKTSWPGKEVTPAMGTIRAENPNRSPAWGAAYWQYFEQLDKITFAGNKVNVQKQLFLQVNTASGPKLLPLIGGTSLKPGDLVKVRIILESDRDMEYVHLKDMRAAGLEPINVMSEYKWQDGLGYYESTRDAATNFFFDWLPKGKHVFEYPLRATYRGDFSNGVTTLQCMYAPEFCSHSEGARVRIR